MRLRLRRGAGEAPKHDVARMPLGTPPSEQPALAVVPQPEPPAPPPPPPPARPHDVWLAPLLEARERPQTEPPQGSLPEDGAPPRWRGLRRRWTDGAPDPAAPEPLSEPEPPRPQILRWRAAGAPPEVAPDREDRRRLRLPRRRPPAGEAAEPEPLPAAAGSPPPPAVAATAVVKRYGDGGSAVEALRGVSVAFRTGTFNAIMGPSGSGKSTLMHILAGLDTPSGGAVEIGGIPLAGLSDRELTVLRRERVGFLFQSFNLLPVLSAEENVVLPLSLAGRRPEREWLDELLEDFGLTERRRHRPAELSGGEQQRVALARALIARPAVVFADEPTGNLDSASGDDVLATLRRARTRFNQTIVMVTHDPRVAARADRVVFLDDGRVVGDLEHPTAERILDVLRVR